MMLGRYTRRNLNIRRPQPARTTISAIRTLPQPLHIYQPRFSFVRTYKTEIYRKPISGLSRTLKRGKLEADKLMTSTSITKRKACFTMSEEGVAYYNVIMKLFWKGHFSRLVKFFESINPAFLEEPHYVVYVRSLIEIGEFSKALKTLRFMEKEVIGEPDPTSYLKIFSSLAKLALRSSDPSKHINMMFKAFKRLKEIGYAPPPNMYSVLLTLKAEQMNVDSVNSLLLEMNELGMRPSDKACGVLIRFCVKRGQPEDALNIAKMVRDAGGVVIFANMISIIHSFNANKMSHRNMEVLQIIRTMYPDLRIDIITYHIILCGLIRDGNYLQAIELVKQMVGDGFMLSKDISNDLMKGLASHSNDPEMKNKLIEIIQNPEAFGIRQEFVPMFQASLQKPIKARDLDTLAENADITTLQALGITGTDAWRRLIVKQAATNLPAAVKNLRNLDVQTGIKLNIIHVMVKKLNSETVVQGKLLADYAMELNPDDHAVISNIWLSRAFLLKHPEAIQAALSYLKYYNIAISLRTRITEAVYNIMQGKIEEAKNILELQRQIEPLTLGSYTALFDLLMESKNYDAIHSFFIPELKKDIQDPSSFVEIMLTRTNDILSVAKFAKALTDAYNANIIHRRHLHKMAEVALRASNLEALRMSLELQISSPEFSANQYYYEQFIRMAYCQGRDIDAVYPLFMKAPTSVFCPMVWYLLGAYTVFRGHSDTPYFELWDRVYSYPEATMEPKGVIFAMRVALHFSNMRRIEQLIVQSAKRINMSISPVQCGMLIRMYARTNTRDRMCRVLDIALKKQLVIAGAYLDVALQYFLSNNDKEGFEQAARYFYTLESRFNPNTLDLLSKAAALWPDSQDIQQAIESANKRKESIEVAVEFSGFAEGRLLLYDVINKKKRDTQDNKPSSEEIN